jgi:hypothetical protein
MSDRHKQTKKRKREKNIFLSLFSFSTSIQPLLFASQFVVFRLLVRLWLDSKLILCILVNCFNETMAYSASLYVSISKDNNVLNLAIGMLSFTCNGIFTETLELLRISDSSQNITVSCDDCYDKILLKIKALLS